MAVVIILLAAANGNVPQKINYQGRLTDGSTGEPVNDSCYTIIFHIWDDSTMGALMLWQETDTVCTEAGLFFLTLGNNNPLTESIFNDSLRYLGIQISGQDEIYPRRQLLSMPYAYRVETIDGAAGGTIAGPVKFDDSAKFVGPAEFAGSAEFIEPVGIGTDANDSAMLMVQRTGEQALTGIVVRDSSEGINLIIDQAGEGGAGLWVYKRGLGEGMKIVKDDDGGALRIQHLGTGSALSITKDSTGLLPPLLDVHTGGNVGIGINEPGERLEVSGIVYSNTGGFRFPDGTLQATAATESNWEVTDSVLYTKKCWGLARGNAGNVMHGNKVHSHINFGSCCTTGTAGQDYDFLTIAGGHYNVAAKQYGTVSGGYSNVANGQAATISGGRQNEAIGNYSSIGGGTYNSISGESNVIAGGEGNSILGGYLASTISGGIGNAITGHYCLIGSGTSNAVSECFYSLIAGGYQNRVAGDYSAILGGYGDTITSTGDYSYLFGINSTLTADSTFMVDMPHIHFGDEATGYEFPLSDGEEGQVMETNGNGQLSWTTAPGSAGMVPVGSVVAWMKSFPNTPALPDNFVECNGQTLGDLDSPYYGEVIPNLNGVSGTKRFLRGSSTSGGFGGSETHMHTLSLPPGTPAGVGGGSAVTGGNYTTNATSNLPPYYEVVWIMRIK